MLVVDPFKKGDPPLRILTWIVAAGLGLLFAGLWWVQIASSRDYQSSLETQSFRTVRIPAVRGKILDCNGATLAENRPTHSLCLYLEELRDAFAKQYARMRPVQVVSNDPPFWKLGYGHPAVKTQYVKLRKEQLQALTWAVRYSVCSNATKQVSQCLHQPLLLEPAQFQRHYSTRLALPYPVLPRLTAEQIALLEEQMPNRQGIDIETQSLRVYPRGITAAHILGSLRRDETSQEGEEAFFSFRLPDYRGNVGIEFGYDKELRGQAGAKSVLVNNAGYRHTENIWSPAEPGRNVVLTIDVRIQEAAERALQGAKIDLRLEQAAESVSQRARSSYGTIPRGAVVVMDVHTGDILALASSPAYNPNYYVHGWPPGEHQRMSDLSAEKNRATQEHYAPGSVFKTLVGLACLEAGLNPKELYQVQENPALPGSGRILVGNVPFKDPVAPGNYDFRRALKRSSNSYFIHYGLQFGPERIVRLAQRARLGERIGLPTLQETGGSIPSLQRLRSGWTQGNTANLCIGQDPVLVTPLQVAVLTAAIANGGKVLWPRLVDRIEPQAPASEQLPVVFAKGRVRDQLGVREGSLAILREAMLADTEDADGTGRRAVVPGLRICGKTGTAQVQNERNVKTGQTTWFASFAPYEQPRYAVVVMVENGLSGGETCAPVARDIYQALLQARLCKPQ